MRTLIFYFIILLISIWLGIKIHADSGYVLVSYQNWSFETSMWFAALCLFLSIIVIYFLLRFLHYILGLSGYLHRWSDHRKLKKARKWTNQGLCELTEGHWQRAEKLLIRAVKYSDTPLINYLAAASAAQQQQAYDRRDNYLRLAHDSTAGSEEMAVGLTQAQLQLRSNQLEMALATLRHLNHIAPHHTFVLKLLKDTYYLLNDWKGLQSLLPELRKSRLLNDTELLHLEEITYKNLLEDASKKSAAALDQAWHEIPRHLHKNPVIVGVYAHCLSQWGEVDHAEKILYQTLKKQWSEQLLTQFGDMKAQDPAKQLTIAESWLEKHPNNSRLLITLGKICTRNRLWGKAQSYLEAALKIKPEADIYNELGKIFQQQGNKVEAMKYFQQGLQLCLDTNC